MFHVCDVNLKVILVKLISIRIKFMISIPANSLALGECCFFQKGTFGLFRTDLHKSLYPVYFQYECLIMAYLRTGYKVVSLITFRFRNRHNVCHKFLLEIRTRKREEIVWISCTADNTPKVNPLYGWQPGVSCLRIRRWRGDGKFLHLICKSYSNVSFDSVPEQPERCVKFRFHRANPIPGCNWLQIGSFDDTFEK